MTGLSYEGRTVFCRDVFASATYYQEVLGLQRAFEGGGDIAMTLPAVDHPDAMITLYLHPADDPTPEDLGSFHVPDICVFLEHYRESGYPVLAGPTDTPWGTREATINDLDGNGLNVSATL